MFTSFTYSRINPICELLIRSTSHQLLVQQISSQINWVFTPLKYAYAWAGEFNRWGKRLAFVKLWIGHFYI